MTEHGRVREEPLAASRLRRQQQAPRAAAALSVSVNPAPARLPGPPASMSANLCPACRIRYLPLQGACGCGGWRVTPRAKLTQDE